MVGKERNLGFESLRVRYFSRGEYILIGGLNKACLMFTREGIRLGMIGDQQNSWVWCCEAHPSGNFIVRIKVALSVDVDPFLTRLFRRLAAKMAP